MFLRQQTNCSDAHSKTLPLLANEVEQAIEEKYIFLIGLPYYINFLGDSFSVLTISKWSLCTKQKVVCSVCLVLFVWSGGFFGGVQGGLGECCYACH